MDLAQTVRDILIILYLMAGIVLTLALVFFALLLFLATKKLLKSMNRAADNFGKVSDSVVEHIVAPLEQGVSISKTLGGAAGFLIGFVAGLRGDKDDEGGSNKKKRFGLF